ncbi:MAG: SpoIIE family protein phosphatase [Steroidobacteraceae bacterium]|nr:SpoIIE family protein phosphatase [Deltaproteobacteria bacterium]
MNKTTKHRELQDILLPELPLVSSFLNSSEVVHLAMLDNDGCIQFANQALSKCLKVACAEMEGKNFINFLTGPDGETLTKRLSAADPFADEELLLNVVDVDQAPHSLRIRFASAEGGFLLLGEPPLDKDQAFKYELSQLNNQLSVLSRENIRKGRDLAKALADVKDHTMQLENERALAHKVLENILPQRFELPGFTTAVMFRPSDQIGGDFFDAWSDGDFTHFLIGDISGHSTSAALMMAVSKGIFRSLGYTMTDPVEIVRAANRMLCPMMLDSRMFLTLVYVLFDRRDNRACFVSAGHNPVYHLDGSEILSIESTGPVIGWDAEDSWESVSCRFDPGMLLFLYTDGLAEAKDAAGREFGEKLHSELADFRSPQASVDGIFAAAEKFSGGNFADDVTIFVIERELS